MPEARPLAVDAVLFDLDGTLADTAGDLAGALNAIRRERGLAPLPVEDLRAHASAGARGMLQAGLGIGPGDDGYDALRDAFLAHYAACLAETTRLFDGVAGLLDALDARGFAWGIVTNKAGRFTRPVVAALGLAGRAGTVVSGDTTPHAKPHPAPMHHAARELGVAAQRCVYVGDDLRDVLAGNAAGMATLVARWGYLGTGEPHDAWPAHGGADAPLGLLHWLPARPGG
ncbi:MAG: HAD-IA family hydrolase [Burkholderiales bacterium]|nr:HAD-IA family hydrolase [Burkholderiales bacterium]GIK86678.1 MAG: phosphatase [Betaproteobacteria bacterium]